jgi:outer membrane cobalamin receptor
MKKLIVIFALLFTGAFIARADFVPAPDMDSGTQVLDIGRVLVEDEEPAVESTVNEFGQPTTDFKGRAVESSPAVNIDDLLSSVPGVYSGKSGLLSFGTGIFTDSNLKIRGLGATPNSGILVVVDGVPRSMGVFKHPIFDALPLGPDDTVEVVTGPSGVLYGNMASAAVINITTQKLETDGSRTTLGTMLGNHYTQDHSVSTLIKKEEVDLGASAEYGSTAGDRPNSDSYEENAHGRISYKIDDSWKISAQGDYSYVRDYNPGPEGVAWNRDAEAFDLIQRDGTLSIENKLGDFSGNVSFYTDSGSNKFLENAMPMIPGLPSYIFVPGSYSQYDYEGARGVEEWVIFPGNSTKFGFDYYYLGTFLSAGPGESRLSEDSYSPYLSFSQVVGIFSISAGFRYDINSRWGQTAVPQAGFKISLFEGQSVYVNASKGFNTPAPGQLAFENYNSLKPESYWQYEVGMTHDIMDVVTYGVSFYQTEGSNLFVTDALNNVSNTGTILFRGIDTNMNIRLFSNYDLGGTLSYLDPRGKTAGQAILSGSVSLKAKFNSLETGIKCGFAKDRFDADNRQQKLGDYALLGADISYRAKFFDTDDVIYLSLDDLADRIYYVKTGYPGPGFDLKAGLTIKF